MEVPKIWIGLQIAVQANLGNNLDWLDFSIAGAQGSVQRHAAVHCALDGTILSPDACPNFTAQSCITKDRTARRPTTRGRKCRVGEKSFASERTPQP
jgi:hypothetical protein